MDGVLATFVEDIFKEYFRQFGIVLDPKLLKDIMKLEAHPFVRPGTSGFFHDIMCDINFWRNMTPMKDGPETLEKLYNIGHDIVIVTAVPGNKPMVYEGKRLWLDKYLPWLPDNNVISAKRKDLITGDILLDDSLINLTPVALAENAAPVAFTQPWNSTWQGLRVADWNDFYRFVVTR